MDIGTSDVADRNREGGESECDSDFPNEGLQDVDGVSDQNIHHKIDGEDNKADNQKGQYSVDRPFSDEIKSSNNQAEASSKPPKPSEFRRTYRRPKGMSHYAVVGVSPTATSQDIKKAYIIKARQLHPDVNTDDPDAAEKFVDLQVAYQVLSSPRKRSDYDLLLRPEQEQRYSSSYELFKLL